jgi:hypothetical protein
MFCFGHSLIEPGHPLLPRCLIQPLSVELNLSFLMSNRMVQYFCGDRPPHELLQYGAMKVLTRDPGINFPESITRTARPPA